MNDKMIYVEGKIVRHTWGYDQTNVDFYLIVKRTATTVTLQPIGSTETETGFMSGYSIPNPDELTGPAIRRRVVVYDGQEQGMRYADYAGAGWIQLWNGNPAAVSWYA